MPSTQMIEDIDRPPAGTACAACRTLGHFCPATRYFGDTDRGICDPCANDQDCATKVAVRRATDNFSELAPADFVPSPVRIIPREEWPEEEITKQSSTEVQDVCSAEPIVRQVTHRHLAAEQFTKGDSDVKRSKYFIPPETKQAIIAASPEISNLELSRIHNISPTSVMNIRHAAGIKSAPRKLGQWRKPEEREKAAAMLRAGETIRATVTATGLAHLTVERVKKELNMTRPTAGRPRNKLPAAIPINEALVETPTIVADAGSREDHFLFEREQTKFEKTSNEVEKREVDDEAIAANQPPVPEITGGGAGAELSVVQSRAYGATVIITAHPEPSVYTLALANMDMEIGALEIRLERLRHARASLAALDS